MSLASSVQWHQKLPVLWPLHSKTWSGATGQHGFRSTVAITPSLTNEDKPVRGRNKNFNCRPQDPNMLPLTQGSAIKWVNCILYWWLCALVDINPCHVQITPILSFWWLHKVDYNASPYGSALLHNREWAREL